MKRFIWGLLCPLLACCNSEKPDRTKIYDAANGVNFVLEHHSGPALSQAEDKLYLISDDERKLVFDGYGGSALSLPSLKKGILVVAYCEGAIRRTESFLAKENSSGEVVAVKVQPIITSGILMNGTSVCQN